MTDPEITALAERLERVARGSAISEVYGAERFRWRRDLRALLSEREVMRGALVRVNQMLTIPAAEYVPAIPEVWAVIEAALAALAPKEPSNA